MDIEGWEVEALAGALEVVARFGPRMALAVYHKRNDPEAICQLALDARSGYKLVRRDKFAYFY
jgi:hypothetical protein